MKRKLILAVLGLGHACCIPLQAQSQSTASTPIFEFRMVDRTVTASRTAETPLDGVLRVKNRGPAQVFSWLDTWTVLVHDREDRPLLNKGWREKPSDWTRNDARLLNPGETASILVSGRLRLVEGEPHFVFKETFGGLLIFGPIASGQYSVAIEYEQDPAKFATLVSDFLFNRLQLRRESLWQGRTETTWQKVDVFVP